MRDCISCQARACKEHAFALNACMRYIDIARFKIHTSQTAWCCVAALSSSCRLQDVLPEMRCQTELLVMHLSLQAEWVLIQNLYMPFSRADPGYLAHCLPPRPSLYPDPSAQVCRHGTILLRAFRSITTVALHVHCVTVVEGSQSGPAEECVSCSNPC